MNDRELVFSLKPGDILHIPRRNDGKLKLYVSVVLRVKENPKEIFISLPSTEELLSFPSPYNPQVWNEEKQTLIDRDGDVLVESPDVLGVERAAAIDLVKKYESIPRQEHVKALLNQSHVDALRKDPSVDIIVGIVRNHEVGRLPDVVSLVLDHLQIKYDERQLGLLSIMVAYMLKTLANEVKIGLVVDEKLIANILGSMNSAGEEGTKPTVH